MSVVDVHTHLYHEPDMDVESNLADHDVESIAREYVARIRDGPADHAIAIVMDEDFLLNDGALTALRDVQDNADVFSTCFLIDPLRDDANELVTQAAESGAFAVKFHPYMQSIHRDEFKPVQEVGQVIEEEELLTIVDCSYGSEMLYETNGVELGHELARTIDSPVLLAHGGGPRILDAFSSADALTNVYLDTSFSLSFWEDSTLIQDYGFVASRLGGEKILWGSDHPFVDQTQSFERAQQFADTYINDPGNYFGETAVELIDRI